MKTINIHIFDKNSSESLTETIIVSDKSTEKETKEEKKNRIGKRKEEIFADVPFARYYFEVEAFDSLTPEESEILNELEIELI